jgi:hypothetical protein
MPGARCLEPSGLEMRADMRVLEDIYEVPPDQAPGVWSWQEAIRSG